MAPRGLRRCPTDDGVSLFVGTVSAEGVPAGCRGVGNGKGKRATRRDPFDRNRARAIGHQAPAGSGTDRHCSRRKTQGVIAQQVGKDVDVAVNVECPPAGRTVVVNAPGTPIACTATNADDPSDSAAITVTVAADGTPSYEFA